MVRSKVLCGAILAILVNCLNAQNFDGVQKPFPAQRYVLGEFSDEDPPEAYYLPDTIIPSLYELTLEPNFDTNTFNGNVTIFGTAAQSFDSIVMHSLNLDIRNATVYSNNQVVSIPGLYYFIEDYDFLVIDLEEPVIPNSKIRVEIEYNGVLNTDRTRGFYIAKYTNESGEERKLATTHLEPTSARELYPCFDEPALKANFSLAVVRPKEYNSLTNMPLAESTEWYYDDTKDIDYFYTSPPMSTYLVAVVVSDFETISETVGDVDHQIHGEAADLEKGYGDLALESSIKVVHNISNYVGVNFTLPKLGGVAIPDGYFSGAMENWGLVVYGERSLLFKPNISTSINAEGVLNIIAHELGHQWFGNLVSPARWAYTWLNEGFATYFAIRATAAVQPSWNFSNQFPSTYASALKADSSPNTHAMTVPVGKSSDIRALFDVISYDKSGSVIRMFEHILGLDNFAVALNLYLNDRKFAGATADDLSASFAAALKSSNPKLAENIKTIFDSWHLQKGFPLVTATRDYEKNTLTLRQQRFIADGSTSDEIYHIPINYFFNTSTAEEKADTQPQLWLDQREITIDLPEEARDSYVILNKHYTGYYRVNYDEANWYRIIENDRSFFDMKKTRAQLLEDAINLGGAGLVSRVVARRVFLAIAYDDDDFTVTKSAIQYLDKIYFDDHNHPDILAYLIRTFKKAYQTYSSVENGGSYVDTVIRDELIPRLCRISDPDCLADMHLLMQTEEVLQAPNLQTSVVCAGLMNKADAKKKFDLVLQYIEEATSDEARLRLMRALPCTKDPEMGLKILDWIVFPETNYLNWNLITLLNYYCEDYENAGRALTYYLQEFTTIQENHEPDTAKEFLLTIARHLNLPANVQTIKDFVEGPIGSQNKEMFEEAINIIQTNISLKPTPDMIQF